MQKVSSFKGRREASLAWRAPVAQVKTGVPIISLLESGSVTSLLDEAIYYQELKPHGYVLQSLEGLTLRAANAYVHVAKVSIRLVIL